MESFNYFTFRFSYDIGLEPSSEDQIIQHMMSYANLFGLTIGHGEWTTGYHLYNAYGDSTSPHFHIHFRGDKTLAAYRKSFQRFAETDTYAFGRKGVKLYSLKQCNEEYIKDIKRFFRYPFKMVHLCEIHFNNYFSEDDLPIQIELAVTEFEERKARLLEKRAKDAEKKTTYDKFIEFLEDAELQNITDVRRKIIKFYVLEKMSCNPKTMEGYVNTYCLQNNLMSEDEFMDLMKK